MPRCSASADSIPSRGEAGIAVLVQQALLRRDQRAGAVDEERPALEHQRRHVPADAEVAREQLRHPRVERRRLRRLAPNLRFMAERLVF